MNKDAESSQPQTYFKVWLQGSKWLYLNKKNQVDDDKMLLNVDEKESTILWRVQHC